MAWNPSPQVGAARDFGNRFGADRVVIFYTLPDGRFGYASYGQTPALCGLTRKAADQAYAAMGQAFADHAPPPIRLET